MTISIGSFKIGIRASRGGLPCLNGCTIRVMFSSAIKGAY